MKYAGLWLLFVCCVPGFSLFAQPATAPTPEESLVHGTILFAPPAGWTLQGKSNTGQLAMYAHPSPKASLAINVDAQSTNLDESAANQIGQTLCQRVRDSAAKGQFQLLAPPKAEPDKRFFLRIHYRYKKDGVINDALQLYRVIGKNLVAAVTVCESDSAEQSAPVFGDAEQTLISAHSPAPASKRPG